MRSMACPGSGLMVGGRSGRPGCAEAAALPKVHRDLLIGTEPTEAVRLGPGGALALIERTL
jgi:hypothetical protein